MPGPFPGMDPYLERPALWRGVHHLLISQSLAQINPALPDGFVASIDERCYVVGPERVVYPDLAVIGHRSGKPRTAQASTGLLERTEDPPQEVRGDRSEITEAFIEIRTGDDWQRVIAVIEFLSPSNKTVGHRGREEYLRKQTATLASETSLLEIDLLREGPHTVCAPLEALREEANWDYLVTLHEWWRPEYYLFWPVSLRDRLPRVRVPLTPEIEPVTLDLQEVLEQAYDTGRFGTRVVYSGEPSPPLSRADSSWADGLLLEKGLRSAV